MAIASSVVILGIAVPMAFVIDAAFGEPRNAWHPVAWFGHAVSGIGRSMWSLRPGAAFACGALAWIAACGGIATLAWFTQQALLRMSPWMAVPLLALLLKPMFAWRMLYDEVSAVESALAGGESSGVEVDGLRLARERLARLVSRDVSAFDTTAIRETTIETLAENLSDSLVAPLFWYAVFGLPGAVLYRAANTLDAMWGYRGNWEWAGKFSARADDVLSWIPARLTALLLMPTWRFASWKALRDQARNTPSPNGGWPMSAIALRLGVRLRKPGVYALNASAPSPDAMHFLLAKRYASDAAWGAVIASTTACFLRGFFGGLLP
jgi:adenosylcobinamide-phosphate synthase